MKITKLEQIPKPYEVEFENLPVLADIDFGFEPTELDFTKLELYRPSVRIFCFDEHNNIGIVESKQSSDRFYIAGGGVEKNETLIDAARREVLEELGDELDNITPLVRFIYRDGIGFFDNYFFSAKIIRKGSPTTTQENELGKKFFYVSVPEYLEMLEKQVAKEPRDSHSLVIKYFLENLLS